MRPNEVLRGTGGVLRCLTFVWGCWFGAYTPSVNATEALNETNTFAQCDYELKLKDHELKHSEHWLSILGFGGSSFALIFGYFQYRKADQWKRAEFLAKEMKEFFEDSDVRNVLLMIDWAPRRINLFHAAETDPNK